MVNTKKKFFLLRKVLTAPTILWYNGNGALIQKLIQKFLHLSSKKKNKKMLDLLLNNSILLLNKGSVEATRKAIAEIKLQE